MKALLAITIALAAALHSSGWKPGAVTSASIAFAGQDTDHAPTCSGFPPGAMNVAFNDAPTFATIDITIDPQGQPLGAYQFELTAIERSFLIVGVSGGDHPAFNHGRPPYFDPVATQGDSDRLVLAEYALPELDAGQLPAEPIIVARVTIMTEPGVTPQPQLKLTTAGNADGQRIDATIHHTFRNPDSPERPE